jgi:hypothetical protein
MRPPVDLGKLRIPGDLILPRSHRGIRRHFERFLKGPVPLAWLQRAARLPGKALHVALVLRYLSGLSKGLTVKLPRCVLLEFGVGRSSADRGLRDLQRAGLVTVARHRGRHPVVTVVEVMP